MGHFRPFVAIPRAYTKGLKLNAAKPRASSYGYILSSRLQGLARWAFPVAKKGAGPLPISPRVDSKRFYAAALPGFFMRMDAFRHLVLEVANDGLLPLRHRMLGHFDSDSRSYRDWPRAPDGATGEARRARP